MSNSEGRNPILTAIVVLIFVGGGWYFFRHFAIEGLDQVSFRPKSTDAGEVDWDSLEAAQATPTSNPLGPVSPTASGTSAGERTAVTVTSTRRTAPARNLKLACWALDGLGPTKLSRDVARENMVRVIRQFDVVALQQISAVQSGVVPRLVEALNEGQAPAPGKAAPGKAAPGKGQAHYDFVLGPPTGPSDRQEQFAFLFNTSRLVVDRAQTYVVADPQDQLTYDPLVAWFRAAEPATSVAWTFSLVNVRIDLAKAASEVAILPTLYASIRQDGRGEDDVILAGLFQADDDYLLPTLAIPTMTTAVSSTQTDIYSRHQTSNLLFDRRSTREYVGGGGVLDFLRAHNLNLAEAEAVTTQLPVYGEFSPLEGGSF